VSVLLNSLKPPEMIVVRVQLCSLDLIGTLSWCTIELEKLPTAFACVLFELKLKTKYRSCRCDGRLALRTRISSEAEETRTSSGDAALLELRRNSLVLPKRELENIEEMQSLK